MPPRNEGQRVPEVTFRVRQDGDWTDVTTAQLFAGKSVVLFALPGAFTPTCSSKHLPRFNQLAPAIKVHGIDEVICLAVNDGFVMDMLIDKRGNGFGERSRRYAMLVRDRVIEKLYVEELRPDGTETYGVSDADTILTHLAG